MENPSGNIFVNAGLETAKLEWKVIELDNYKTKIKTLNEITSVR